MNHGRHCVVLVTNAIRSQSQQTDQRRQRLGCVSILAFNSVPVVPLGHYPKTRYLTSSRTSLLTICDGLSSRVPRLIILLLVDHDTFSKWSAQRLRKTIRWSWSCTDKKDLWTYKRCFFAVLLSKDFAHLILLAYFRLKHAYSTISRQKKLQGWSRWWCTRQRPWSGCGAGLITKVIAFTTLIIFYDTHKRTTLSKKTLALLSKNRRDQRNTIESCNHRRVVIK